MNLPLSIRRLFSLKYPTNSILPWEMPWIFLAFPDGALVNWKIGAPHPYSFYRCPRPMESPGSFS